MITCSRCSKENQNHYKFCLGCGAKLDVPSGDAARPPAQAAPVSPNASTAPAGGRLGTPGSSLGTAPTAAPLESLVPSPAPDKPDKPEKSPESRPAVAPAEANAAAASGHRTGSSVSGVITTPPVARPAGLGNVYARSTGTPQSGPGYASTLSPSPSGLAGVPAAVRATAAPTPAPVTPGIHLDGIALATPAGVCPTCGKGVNPGNAFCGSCGQRLKPAPGPSAGLGFPPATTSRAGARGHLTLIRPDGTEGGVHPLHDGENLIGRGQGSLFDADPYLSPRHAECLLTDEGLLVRDLKSLNGVFVKITQEEKLESGDIFRIGQELLRFDLIAPPAPLEDGTEIIGTPNPGYWGRISVVIGRDVDGPAFPLFDESIVLGRERGDILFPEDGYVSGTHAQITLRDGQIYLSDLGSSNGTFFRLRGSRRVPPGSLVLMGQQLFRVAFR